jgi:hypothetical protein
MKQKIFLTSCIAMGVIAPAMAETFPSNGLMQENKTYDNAATSTNMDGVYEGTVNAVAEYDIIDYIVNAGQYLPADSETVITCPAGSFCPGIDGNVQYNQSSDQGIQTCPTGYANSAAGASSDTECYRQCSGNVTIAHATGVTGFDYYGNGTDTCAPTSCENGYHVGGGSLDLTSLVGETSASDYGYIELYWYEGMSSEDTGYYAHNASKYGLNRNNDRGKFVVDFGNNGKITGIARCSTQEGVINYNWKTHELIEITKLDEVSDDVGGEEYAGNCYCKLDGYIPNGGEKQTLSGPWVFAYYNSGDNTGCDEACASDCANIVGNNDSWVSAKPYIRSELFSSVTGGGSGTATCEANTITINWSNADANDISANNAGTATYGSDVRTPVKAQTIKGKTFKGWRFSAPEQTNLSN